MRLEMDFPAKKEKRSFKKVYVWAPIQTYDCPFQQLKKSFKKETIGCANRLNKRGECDCFDEEVDQCPFRVYSSAFTKNSFVDDEEDDKN